MVDLVQWLTAQLDEDERIARATVWDGSGNKLDWELIASATIDVGGDEFYVGDRTIANHMMAWEPARVLREIEIDRGMLAEYERLLRAWAAHQTAAHALAADIEQEERTGEPKGDGLSDVRQRALRREADYLPAMLRVLERWAKGKATVYADRPGYQEEWRP